MDYDLFTSLEWKNALRCGAINEYDGTGYYAQIVIHPQGSSYTAGSEASFNPDDPFPKDYHYVMWYNK